MSTALEPIVAWLNAALSWVGDLALRVPLATPPLVGLTLIAIATAAVVVVVIARTSDQARLKQSKRGIQAALFELRLFNDNLRAVWRALGDALRHNAMHLRLTLVPLAWMAIPLTLLLIQIQSVYGYTGLAVGSSALVKVEMDDAGAAADLARQAVLDVPEGVRVDAGPVFVPSVNTVLWRIVPHAAGEYVLTLRSGGLLVTKSLTVGSAPGRRSPRRVSGDVLEQMLNPSEAPLPPGSHITSVSIQYPDAEIEVWGWSMHWMVPYLVLTFLAALLFAKRYGVAV